MLSLTGIGIIRVDIYGGDADCSWNVVVQVDKIFQR